MTPPSHNVCWFIQVCMPGKMLKHVCCNPAVAPRLTSGGCEDKVDVITPVNLLFRGGCKFQCDDDHGVMMWW